MQDLTLVGVHDDGEHLVLCAPDGSKYRVRVDEPLRAAVRRDRARLGQLQIELDGRLRPRDIQTRIRAGQTAEQIAEESGLPVEHVRRYEGPVLAEREFVVRQARAVRMRGLSRLDGTVPTLGELVGERLAAREVEHSDSSWDAWRGDDGTWLVALTFTAGTRDRRAIWTYDAQLRHVSPQDDEARWLTEAEQAPSAHPGAAVHRRLMPVRTGDRAERAEHGHDRVYDLEADEPEQFSPSAPAATPEVWPAAATVDLLDTLRERRGRRQRPTLDTGDLDFDLPDVGGQHGASGPRGVEPQVRHAALDLTELDDVPAAHPPRSRPDLATDAEVLSLPEPVQIGADAGSHRGAAPSVPVQTPAESPLSARSAAASGHDRPTGGAAAGANGSASATSAGAATASGTTPANPPTPPAPTRRSKRASVPSWDDIIFGGRRE